MNCMSMNCVYNGQKMVLFNIRNSYILRPKLPKAPIFLANILLYSYILGKTWLTAWKPLKGCRPNSTGMVPGWSPTEFVQMVLIGCIGRSRGQK